MAVLTAALALGLFAGPAVLARKGLDTDPNEGSYQIAFSFVLSRVPDLKLDRNDARDGRLPLPGGGFAPKRCLKAIRGGTGWICVSLSPDGRKITAVWVAEGPNEPASSVLIQRKGTIDAPAP